jgi:hypothetical protein
LNSTAFTTEKIRRVRPDAEGERRERRQGEARALAEHAKRMFEVLDEVSMDLL